MIIKYGTLKSFQTVMKMFVSPLEKLTCALGLSGQFAFDQSISQRLALDVLFA